MTEKVYCAYSPETLRPVLWARSVATGKVRELPGAERPGRRGHGAGGAVGAALWQRAGDVARPGSAGSPLRALARS